MDRCANQRPCACMRVPAPRMHVHTWDAHLQDFYIEAAYDQDGCVSGILRLELYDWNKSSDEYVGCVDVDLAAFELDASTLVCPWPASDATRMYVHGCYDTWTRGRMVLR